MTDLDGRCFVKKRNTLVPADFAAAELLDGIKEGSEIIVKIRRPRNPACHRWFFAMLRIVCDNVGLWYDEEDLLDALKRAIGYTTKSLNIDGSSYERPRSISFSALSEDEFSSFRERCLDVLATKVLGCSPEELMAETDATQKRAA